MRGGDAGEYVVRFSYWQRFQHAMVILLFGVLLVIAVVLMWIVTWMLFKFLRAALRRLRDLFSSASAPA